MTAPAELDLDQPSPVPGPRSRSGSPWYLAAAVATLAAVLGAVLHGRLSGADPPAPPRVLAWLTLDGVRLADRAHADLHLVVASRDDATVYLTGLDLAGGGAAAQRQVLWRPLTPGVVEDLHLPVGLACGPGSASTPLRLSLTVSRTPPGPAGASPPDPRSPGTSTVTAVPDAGLQLPGWLCRTAEQQLPQGSAATVTTRLVSTSPDSLTLQLSGLPAVATDLFSVQADGWLLPVQGGGPARVRDGATTVTVGIPQPRCEDPGTRRVLPTGLQLVLAAGDGSGIREAYAPVGTPLARWLLQARARTCP